MIYTIRTHVLDLLAANAAILTQSGSAYAPNGTGKPAWNGVTRPNNADLQNVAKAGFVNLFDETHKRSGEGHRPAIYVGTQRFKVQDRIDFQAIAGGGVGRVEYRIMIVPLIACAQGQTEDLATRQAEQLRANMRAILFGRVVESGFWYQMMMPGNMAGGFAMEQVIASDTGQGASGGTPPLNSPVGRQTGLAEATACLPLQIKYTQKANSPA